MPFSCRIAIRASSSSRYHTRATPSFHREALMILPYGEHSLSSCDLVNPRGRLRRYTLLVLLRAYWTVSSRLKGEHRSSCFLFIVLIAFLASKSRSNCTKAVPSPLTYDRKMTPNSLKRLKSSSCRTRDNSDDLSASGSRSPKSALYD